MINVLDVRKEFFKKLDDKTNWDKNEIKNLFDAVLIEMQTQEEIIKRVD